MAIFFLDNEQEVIKVVPSDGATSILQTQELPDDDSLLKDVLSVSLKNDERLFDAQYMAIRSFDENRNAFDMYRIVSEIVPDNTTEFEGVQIAPYELEGVVVEDARPDRRRVEQVAEQILQDSDWSVGYVEDNLPRVTTNFYYLSAKDSLKKLQEVANVEIQFKVEISGNKITDKWIEIYKQLGDRTLKRFNYGTNALTIKRETTSDELFTALIGRGKGEEVGETEAGDATYGRKINFKDVVWKKSKGRPVDKPKGQKYIELPSATAEYGLKLLDGRKVPRVGLVEFSDTEEPEELIQQTWEALQEYARPKVLFSTTVANIGGTKIGDTVTIHRYELNMHYETRVRKVVRDRKNDDKTQIEIGDVVLNPSTKRQSSINSKLNNLEGNLTNVRNEVTHVVRSANGKNSSYYTNDEPERKRVGDLWWRDHPSISGETQLLIWNGEAWELEIDTSETSKNAERIEEVQDETEEAIKSANDANDKINSAIADAGFSTMEEVFEDLKSRSEDARSNAENAYDEAQDAISRSRNALEEAEGARSRAQEALDGADGANSKATEALDSASDLADEVSGFKIDLDGFNQVINDYEGQVSEFENSIEGFRNTIVQYEEELDNYGDKVDDYATQVSEFENSIDGFRNTVAKYEDEVDGYRSQVSSLQSTIDGFESTVTKVEDKIDNLEINERNLIFNSAFYDKGKHWTGAGDDRLIQEKFISDYIVELEAVDNGKSARLAPETTKSLDKGIYQLSVWYKVLSGNTPQVHLTDQRDKINQYNLGALDNSTKDEWVRDIKEFEVIENGFTQMYALRYPTNGVGNILVGAIKVQKSNKATDWTPAPEDAEEHFREVETSIKQNAEEIELKASRTEVEKISGRVDEAETSITQNADEIAQRAKQSDLDDVSGLVSENESEIVQTNKRIDRRVTKTTYDQLEGRVNEAETSINQNADEIELRAKQSDVDTLEGRVSSNESSISQNAKEISSKVSQSDFDNLMYENRNYLLNSKFLEVKPDKGYETIEFSEPIYKGETITVSVKDIEIITNETDPEEFRFAFRKEDGSSSTTKNLRLDKYQTTFTTSSDIYRVFIYGWNTVGPSGNRVKFHKLQLEKGNKETPWSPAPEDTEDKIEHVESEFKQRADSIESNVSSLDGRITNVSQDLDSITTRVGDSEGHISSIEQTISGIQSDVSDNENNISSITQTVDIIQTNIRDLEDDTESSINQLSDRIDLRVKEGEVVSQISVEAGRTLIDSGKLLINSDTVAISGTAFMDGAVIKDASLDGAKIQDATIDAAKIASIDANKITTGSIRGINIYMNYGEIATFEINGNSLSSHTGYGYTTMKGGGDVAFATASPSANSTTGAALQIWHDGMLRFGTNSGRIYQSGNHLRIVSGSEIHLRADNQIIVDAEILPWYTKKFWIGNRNNRWEGIALGSGGVSESSDARIKSNIRRIPSILIRETYKIEPKIFTVDNNTSFGYIAQDVRKVLKSYINEVLDPKEAEEYLKRFNILDGDDDDEMSIIYSQVEVLKGAYRDKLIQKNTGKIVQIEDEVSELKRENKDLKDRVEELENAG